MKKILALLALPLVAYAEPPKELVMPTDVGKVAITSTPCTVENKHGFVYEAYATEHKDGGVITHKGCWNKKDNVVHIWFYDEEPPIVATFKDTHFKAETKL